MEKSTRVTVVLLFIAWTIDYIDRLVINIALPAIGRDLSLSYTQMGAVISAFFVAYAIMQLPGGLLADRFGSLKIAIIGLIAWSVFTGLTATALTFSALILIRVAFGLAQGIFPGAAMKLLSERSLPEQRMTANGWVNSSNAFGTIVASLIAAALLPLIGWRGMFLAIAALGLISVFMFWKWMPAPLASANIEATRSTTSAMSLVKSPLLWVYVVAFFGYDLLIWGVNSWAVAYLQEVHLLPQATAALVIVFPGLAAVVSIIVSGKIADRLNGRPMLLLGPVMIGGIVMACLIPLISNTLLLVVVVTIGVGLSSLGFTPCLAQPLKLISPQFAGAASGMILMGGMVGGIIAPTAFGMLVDVYGWAVAWPALSIGPVIALLAGMRMPRTAQQFQSRLPVALQGTSTVAPAETPISKI